MSMKMLPKQILAFIPWLVLAGLVDWLVTRTLTRAAIHMPKTPAFISIYQASVSIGQVASNLVSLLVVLILACLAWDSLRRRQDMTLGLICLALISTSLLAVVQASAGWLDLIFQVLFSTALALLIWKAWREPMQRYLRLAIVLSGLAYLSARLFQGVPAFLSTFHLPGPLPWSAFLYHAGELLIILSVLSLWQWSRLTFGRAPLAVWLAAGLPALAFSGLHLSSPAMTGILAIWSVGLSLYLPWPVYTVSIWMLGIAMIQAFRHGSLVSWMILLLVVSGYAAQLDTHAFLGLIAVWLLLIVGRLETTAMGHIQTKNKPVNGQILETDPSFILETIAGRRTY
jgi:hypothetical protein